LPSQAIQKVPIPGEFCQDLFHVRNHVALISKGQLVPYFCMNDISGPAEVCDQRYGATPESFKHDACTEVANRGKDQHIRGSQPPKDLVMGDPATERNTLLDPEGTGHLLETLPFRTVAEHSEAAEIAPQKGRGRSQRQIKSFARN